MSGEYGPMSGDNGEFFDGADDLWLDDTQIDALFALADDPAIATDEFGELGTVISTLKVALLDELPTVTPSPELAEFINVADGELTADLPPLDAVDVEVELADFDVDEMLRVLTTPEIESARSVVRHGRGAWWGSLAGAAVAVVLLIAMIGVPSVRNGSGFEGDRDSTGIADMPGIAVPDAVVPDTSAPDAVVPDTSAPDAVVPDTSASDAVVPDTSAPDAVVPDAVVPLPDAADDSEAVAVQEPQADLVGEANLAQAEAAVVTAGPEAAVQQPTVQEPAVQQPVVQQPAVQQPVVQEPVVQQPAVQQPVVQEPVVQQPVVQEPVVQQPVVQEPVVQQPAVVQPVVPVPVAPPAAVVPEPAAPAPSRPVAEPVAPVVEQPSSSAPSAPVTPPVESGPIQIPVGVADDAERPPEANPGESNGS